jgi:hypothetical protein
MRWCRAEVALGVDRHLDVEDQQGDHDGEHAVAERRQPSDAHADRAFSHGAERGQRRAEENARRRPLVVKTLTTVTAVARG